MKFGMLLPEYRRKGKRMQHYKYFDHKTALFCFPGKGASREILREKARFQPPISNFDFQGRQAGVRSWSWIRLILRTCFIFWIAMDAETEVCVYNLRIQLLQIQIRTGLLCKLRFYDIVRLGLSLSHFVGYFSTCDAFICIRSYHASWSWLTFLNTLTLSTTRSLLACTSSSTRKNGESTNYPQRMENDVKNSFAAQQNCWLAPWLILVLIFKRIPCIF